MLVRKFLLFFYLLFFVVNVNAQKNGIELSLGGYIGQSDFNNINYTIQGQINSTGKLFETGWPNAKLSYYFNNGVFLSVNQTNFGAFSEGATTISSRINSVGLGVGYELRTNQMVDLWNILSIDLGLGIELRGNYNYKHKAEEIIIVGQIANQIQVRDEIEKFTPELSIYLPRISFGIVDSNTFEIFVKPEAHILFFAEKLKNKFSTTKSFSLLNIDNTVELLSISAGVRFKW